MGARTRQKEAISNVIVERIRRRLRHNALRNHSVLQVSPPPAAMGPFLLRLRPIVSSGSSQVVPLITSIPDFLD